MTKADAIEFCQLSRSIVKVVGLFGDEETVKEFEEHQARIDLFINPESKSLLAQSELWHIYSKGEADQVC